MKPIRSISMLLSVGLLGTAAADTFRLKDGSKIEAKVLREDASSYTLEVQVTKSIREERIVKKADVEGIDRVSNDEKAFVGIKDVLPAPDLLTTEDYDSRIRKVRDFIKENPESLTLVKQAREMAASLEKEREQVSQGGVKLGGRIITSEEREANKFEVDARTLEVSFRNKAKAGQNVAALREFEKLDKEYQSSAAYREVIVTVKEVIRRYRAEAADGASTFDARMKKQQAGLELQQSEDRSASAQAIAERDALAKAGYDAEKKGNVKWVTPNAYVKASLEEAVKYADQELKRLDALKLDTLPDGGKAWRDAWVAVHAGGDMKAAAPLISAVRTAKLPDRYVKELEAASKAAGGTK
ncbi:hypothetical protein KBB96_00045 [Luteolibacter ambystomatis]|uniref:Uncharacterized protein n=1 Tax=Luteolibacter ambystomatis TaxID=2824561 RepID=A0A975G9J3_9BACT|nr:PTPDL family protein [Luteolibacter ambystomatis]QUE51306.1 hypothetical protein KBB96_00045 [Luteolibacter ambystomatis]